MMFNNNTENDPMWAALQLAFSPDEAIYFRAYPLKAENTVREVDYVVIHRNGTLAVILTETYTREDLVYGGSIRDGITIFEPLVGETRTHYPFSFAQSFLRSLREILQQFDVSILREVIVSWFPHVSDRNFFETEDDYRIENQFLEERVFLFEDKIHDIAEIIYPATEILKSYRINDEIWLQLKARLNPPSTIWNRIPRLNRNDQAQEAKKLSGEYISRYGKNTLIFVSYRRDDMGWAAGRVYGHLQPVFEGSIFYDYESIKPGVHWVNAIDQALDDCVIQLVVIGPKWASLKKRGSRQPRILEPGDMVAYEIRTGFRKKVTIVPLLIDGAFMPRRNELPYGLKQLPTRNAVLLNQDNFFAKMDLLTDRIIELLDMALK